jgi:hypothetical protein
VLCDERGPAAPRARSAGGAPARNGWAAAAAAGAAADGDGGCGGAAAEEPMYNARALQLWLLHCCQARDASDAQRLFAMLTGLQTALLPGARCQRKDGACLSC